VLGGRKILSLIVAQKWNPFPFDIYYYVFSDEGQKKADMRLISQRGGENLVIMMPDRPETFLYCSISHDNRDNPGFRMVL
jgi:hypothetical protein